MRSMLGLLRQNSSGHVKEKHHNHGRKGQAAPLDRKEFAKKLNPICNKLAETPKAVDALLFVINGILENPRDQKRKQVNVTKPVFHRTIGRSGPWGVRFLEALGFAQSPTKEYYNLHPRNWNKQKLEVGLEKLIDAQKSEVYLLEHDKMKWAKETLELLEDGTGNENARKEEHMNLIPLQPLEGAAGTTIVRVYFGEEDIQRVFASDNTLENVLHWVSASIHSSLLEKLQSGEFELIDRTVYPPKKLAFSKKKRESTSGERNSADLDLLGFLDDLAVKKRVEEKTLQALGLWPSGEVEIQKAGFLIRERALLGIIDNDE